MRQTEFTDQKLVLAGCEVPAEFVSVTDTEPRALISPWTVNGILSRNWLPNCWESVLSYQVVNWLETFTVTSAFCTLLPARGVNRNAAWESERVFE